MSSLKVNPAETDCLPEPLARCRFLAVVLLLCLLVGGCGVGNQFLFSAAREFSSTPADHGLVYEDFWFHARDGTLLNGWVTTGRAGYPLILYFHGNGGNLSDYLEYLALLNSLGFPVCIFDYRGYGRSGGLMHRENDLYEDARGVLDHLRQQGWRHRQMIYYGQSLGAAIALQMALEAPPAGLVLESPFTSLAAVQKHLAPVGYAMFGWWSFNARFDNLGKIGRAGIPLLFISGDRDDLTPVEMTSDLHERAREPKMIHIINGGGHCDAFKHGRLAYRQAWVSFVRSLAHAAVQKQPPPS